MQLNGKIKYRKQLAEGCLKPFQLLLHGLDHPWMPASHRVHSYSGRYIDKKIAVRVFDRDSKPFIKDTRESAGSPGN